MAPPVQKSTGKFGGIASDKCPFHSRKKDNAKAYVDKFNDHNDGCSILLKTSFLKYKY